MKITGEAEFQANTLKNSCCELEHETGRPMIHYDSFAPKQRYDGSNVGLREPLLKGRVELVANI